MPTLQDLLSGNNPIQERYGAPAAGPPPVMNGDPAQMDPQINSLIQALSQPEQIPELPKEKKSNLGQRIASAFADAGMAYAGRPGQYTNTLLARDEQINKEILRNSELVAGAKNKAARNAAEIKLQLLLKKQDRNEATAAEKSALQEERTYKEGVARTVAEAKAQDAAAEAAKDAAKLSWEKEKAKAEIDKDLAVARIHASSKDNPHADYDIKTLPTVMQGLAGLADSAEVALNGGDPQKEIPAMTPQQMRNSIRRNIEASGLSPDGKKAAYAYATSEVEQVIRDFEQAHAPVQGPEPQNAEGYMSPADKAIVGAARGVPGFLKKVLDPTPNRF